MNSRRCKKLMQQLDLVHQNYDELYEHMAELEKELKRMRQENEYQTAFISYQGLDSEYAHFRIHAHRVRYEDLPFDTLTLE